MCFIGLNYPYKVKKGEKVNVMKIVRLDPSGNFVPALMRNGDIKTYEAGKTYEESIDIDFKNPVAEIEVGIHSYLPSLVTLKPYGIKMVGGVKQRVEYNTSIDYDEYYVQVTCKTETLHAYHYDRRINWESMLLNHLCLLVGHIPPGGTYYKNNNGEVVSDTLTVDLIKPYPVILYDKTQFKKDFTI